MIDSILVTKIQSLPLHPGVYMFKNREGTIIYIGKAIRLRQRVSSYFRTNASLDSAKTTMIKEIVDLQIYETDSEIEALVLEAKLIKKYQPKYNILLRDDKSYSYAVFTKEEFPRIFVAHQTYIDHRPKQIDFIGPFTSASSLKNALRVLRKIFPYRSCKTMPKSACVYYRIGRCSAPCIANIDQESYSHNLLKIKSFLKGEKKRLITQIKQEMLAASQNLNFEKAQILKDQLDALQKISIHKDIITTSKSNQKNSAFELQAALNLDQFPKRIEGFDSSHFHGSSAVVSMVVFINGRASNQDYRRFKIKLPPEGGDDFYNLSEALSRRFAKKDWPTPDLILIDGGKGQLSTVKDVQAKGLIQYQNIPIISLAKQEEEVFVPHQNESIKLPKSSKALQLLQRVRDESHRFAVTYHRQLRSKKLLKA
jgi:excinuclease ABC subunit C